MSQRLRLLILTTLMAIAVPLGMHSYGPQYATAAAVFNVDSTADAVDASPGDGTCATAGAECTLRAAVQEANALAGLDTINVPAGVYVLDLGSGDDTGASGDLDITEDVAIVGAGSGTAIIDGNGLDRIFHIGPGSTDAAVEISGVTLQNGAASGGASPDGGAVLVDGGGSSLTLNDSIVTSSTASQFGGGIRVIFGTTVLNSSTVTGNYAEFGGGGVYSDGVLQAFDSAVDGNNTAGNGGGINTVDDLLSLTNTSVSGNHAFIAGGIYATFLTELDGSAVDGNISDVGAGGIFVGPGAELHAVNSSISNNQSQFDGAGVYVTLAGATFVGATVDGNSVASGRGGGVFGQDALVEVIDSSLSNNSSTTGGGAAVVGGSALNVQFSTVEGNSASADGGGLYSESFLTIDTSDVSGNTAGGYGGGAYIASFTSANITGSAITGNGAGFDGGGIWNDGFTNVFASTISGNMAGGSGGGMLAGLSGNFLLVTLTDSTVSDNSATLDGGGVWASADLDVSSSTVSGNEAGGSGGGILNFSFGDVSLVNSTLSGNIAGTTGGGLSNLGTASLLNVTVTGNEAHDAGGAGGGGIYTGAAGDTSVQNTIVAGRAEVTEDPGTPIFANFQLEGADIPAGYLPDYGFAFADRVNGFSYGWNAENVQTRDRNSSSSPDQRYDTLNHMQKPGNPDASWEIEAPDGDYEVHIVSGDPDYIDSIYRLEVEGVLAIDATPDSSNRWFEGTLEVTVSDGRLTVTNAVGSQNNKINFIEITPLAPPAQTPVTVGRDCAGAVSSSGNNIDGDGACSLTAVGDMPQTNPLLQPLADNGGLTLTHGLADGSPALDAANTSAAPPTDQRGNARPVGPDADVGAFEGVAGPPLEPPTADPGGPYQLYEGTTISLDGSGSSDPDGSIVTFEWDLDEDGIFGETGAAAGNGNETGVMPTFSAVGIEGPDSIDAALKVTDNDGLSSTAMFTISVLDFVAVECSFPDPESHLTGQLTGSFDVGEVTNSSPDCSYEIGLAAYSKFDEVLANQEIFDYETAMIPPNSTMELFVELPQCAAQIDLFYGPVLLSFDEDLYGERKLDWVHIGGDDYCETTEPEPEPEPGPDPSELPEGSVFVNFQPRDADVAAGYLVDEGSKFGDRDNGYYYGWNKKNKFTRDRNDNDSPDQRYDTLNHMQKNDNPDAKWEIAVEDGTYQVTVTAGDPDYIDSVYKIKVEGALAIDGVPTESNRWFTGMVVVNVTDGRLTVSSANDAVNNKINFVKIIPQ